MNQRMTLPKMVKVSNDSRLTAELAETLNNKLSNEELANFHRWLQLVETERISFAQRTLKTKRF
jgi:hypothetical protein